MSGLAVAVFAAEAGEHLIETPRNRRFDAFRRSFDEPENIAAASPPQAWPGSAAVSRRSRLDFARSTIRRPGSSCARPSPEALGDADGRDRRCPRMLGLRRDGRRGLARDLAARRGRRRLRARPRRRRGRAPRRAREPGRPSPCSGAASTATTRARTRDAGRRDRRRGGSIVSEYAPGVEPAPWRFPARNRIVAGLADATVVVEARERSGALITADLALDEGREVLAVPGEITAGSRCGHERAPSPRRDAGHVCR